MYLGFADGDEVTAGLEDSSSSEVSCAILLDQRQFWMYQGSDIIGLRVGLTDNVSSLTVFISNDLTATPLYTKVVRSLYAGWNDIDIDAFTIPEGDLYVGYVVNRSTYVGLSGKAFEGSNWLQQDEAGWQALTGATSSLCIQAIVDDTRYKHHDAQLLSLTAEPAAAGQAFNVTGYFRNNTPSVATSLSVSYTYSDGTTHQAEAMTDEVLPGEMGSFTFSADPIAVIGESEFKATLTAVNGVADTYPDNGILTIPVTVYSQLVRRRALVEQFTTARCINCPPAHEIWKRVLRSHPDAIVAAHHCGFYTDDYTLAESEELQVFYNAGGDTYAPACMLNRRNLAEQGAVNGNKVPATGPVFYPSGDEYVDALVCFVESEYAPLTIGLDYSYDASSRQLTIRTEVEPIEGFSEPSDARLNVYLTEDGLLGYQSGASGTYEHNHVVRQFITPTWGEAIPLDTSVGRTYTLVLDSQWDISKMHIIAFVAAHDDLDVNHREVANATSIDLDGASALEMLHPDAGVQTPCFDLMGRRVAPGSGGYVLRDGHCIYF